MEKKTTIDNLFCFSHLRWNFVYQRPQHLMSRFGNITRVFFVEEPLFDGNSPTLDVSVHLKPNVTVITPMLPKGSEHEADRLIHDLLASYIDDHAILPSVFWYYSPMALKYTQGFNPVVSVYDCMDELSGFLFAPPELLSLEAELFSKVDVVFTGGNSLYEAKKERHSNVHAFPSSIDFAHFAKARGHVSEPLDQSGIPSPKIGFYGVLDERLDIALVAEIARLKPEWNFVFIGPVVKISSSALPRDKNIFYLGGRTYESLPSYLSGWDIAMMPFAKNASTRFISPTKTPEYLAGGKPVISTSIADVVNDYGKPGLVSIADTPQEFISCIQKILSSPADPQWMKAVDQHLQSISWDKTWTQMTEIILKAFEPKFNSQSKNLSAHV